MSDVRNVKLGVCRVFYNGTDFGYTLGGVEVSVQTQTHEVSLDQHGKTAVNEFIMSRKVKIKCPLAETTVENLIAIMPGSNTVLDVNGNVLRVEVELGVGINLASIAKTLTLHPISRAVDDYSEDFTLFNAATPGTFNYVYKLDQERVFACEFSGYPDPLTGKVFAIGDTGAFSTGDGQLTYNATYIIQSLGYTPENLTNKVTTLVSANDTTYPTTKAVQNAVDSIDAELLAFEQRVANVETEVSTLSNASSSSSGTNLVVAQTRAQLDQITTAPVGELGYVTNDPTLANNGMYQWGGSSWKEITLFYPTQTVVPQITSAKTLLALNATSGHAVNDLGYVTNDTTLANNGMYQWSGSDWAIVSLYYPAQTVTPTVISAQTLASLNTTSGQAINGLGYVTNDPTLANNGMYQWGGSAWTQIPLYYPAPAPILYSDSIVIPTVATSSSKTLPLTGSSTPYDKQSVVLFLVAAKTTSTSTYTIQINTTSASSVVTTMYQTANITGNFSDLIPFTIDRNLLADALSVVVTNTGTTAAITDMVVRLVSSGV